MSAEAVSADAANAGLAILIPAAGASRRMKGRDKLLEPVAGGIPLLAERIACARATGAPVLVALPPRAQAPARWQAAQDGQRIEVAGSAGMGHSIAALARALPEAAKGALILPADMPDIDLSDLKAMAQAFDAKHVLRATSSDGRHGHPVIFPRAMFARLKALSGDQGARALLSGAPIRLVALPGEHALTDLDTPEAWAAWRARQQGASPPPR